MLSLQLQHNKSFCVFFYATGNTDFLEKIDFLSLFVIQTMSMSDELTNAEMMCVIKNYRIQVEQLEATCRKLNEQHAVKVSEVDPKDLVSKPKSTPWWIYTTQIGYLKEALESEKAIANQHKETIADRDREIKRLREEIKELEEPCPPLVYDEYHPCAQAVCKTCRVDVKSCTQHYPFVPAVCHLCPLGVKCEETICQSHHPNGREIDIKRR